MGFIVFFLVFIFIIVIIALSLVWRILGGVFGFLGLGGNSRSQSSAYGKTSSRGREQTYDNAHYQSEEGAKRMKKFKNAAEDTDFEEI